MRLRGERDAARGDARLLIAAIRGTSWALNAFQILRESPQ
jgi:hypothetical protein